MKSGSHRYFYLVVPLVACSCMRFLPRLCETSWMFNMLHGYIFSHMAYGFSLLFDFLECLIFWVCQNIQQCNIFSLPLSHGAYVKWFHPPFLVALAACKVFCCFFHFNLFSVLWLSNKDLLDSLPSAYQYYCFRLTSVLDSQPETEFMIWRCMLDALAFW